MSAIPIIRSRGERDVFQLVKSFDIAVLLRLRLGLLEEDVADWYSISSFKNYDALLSAVADAGRALRQPDEKRIRACAAAASTDSDAGPGV